MPAELGESERSALLQRFEDQHGPLIGHLADNAAHQFLDRRIDLIRDLLAFLITFFASDRLVHRHSPSGAYRTFRCLLPKGEHCPYLALTQPERTRRSEEHTSELQSLMRISYAVFCLKKNTPIYTIRQYT